MRRNELSSSNGFAEDIEDWLNQDDEYNAYESSSGIVSAIVITTGIAAAFTSIMTIFYTSSMMLSVITPFAVIIIGLIGLASLPGIPGPVSRPRLPEKATIAEQINKKINEMKTKYSDFLEKCKTKL